MENSEIPDILKIPKPLQEKFFAAAEEEVNQLLKRLRGVDKFLNFLRSELSRGIEVVEPRRGWRDMVIGVVDGSDSPAIDQRIGVRYGLYAAAYKLFRGFEPIENRETYVGDRLAEHSSELRESFSKVLDLATVYLERSLASQLIKSEDPKVDLLLIDGSFLGYRVGCSMIKEDPLDWWEPITGKYFRTVLDLIETVNTLTEQIAESGRAVGIIKRVPTMAIDGYLRYRYGADRALNLSDRSILTLIMKTGEKFSYSSYLQGLRYEALSWYKNVEKEKGFRDKTRDKILEEAERRVKVQFLTDLTDYSRGSGKKPEQYEHVGVIKLSRRLQRFFLRTREDLPPICIEVPDTVLKNLLDNVFSYCLETSSAATGLPLCLDLVDDLVSLPRGLGRDFIGEIEAGLLRHGVDEKKMLALFGRFNPQKDEF